MVHIFIAAKNPKVGPTCWLWGWNQGKMCGSGRKWDSSGHFPDTGEQRGTWFQQSCGHRGEESFVKGKAGMKGWWWRKYSTVKLPKEEPETTDSSHSFAFNSPACATELSEKSRLVSKRSSHGGKSFCPVWPVPTLRTTTTQGPGMVTQTYNPHTAPRRLRQRTAETLG